MPAITKAVVSPRAPTDIGKASGTFSTMRQLGGAFGVADPRGRVRGRRAATRPPAFSDGFTAAIGVSAALSLAGAAAGLALPGRRATAPPVPLSPVPQESVSQPS